jgi:excisionase family DNA binding protein
MGERNGWMTTEEAAAEVGMTAQWVRQQIVEGRLHASAWSTGSRRAYRIRARDWDAFVAAYSRRTDGPDWDDDGE